MLAQGQLGRVLFCEQRSSPMDVFVLVGVLDEGTVIATSSACVSGLETLVRFREQALAWGILRRLALLAELDARAQEEDDEDTAYWWSHVAADWDLSD